MPVKRIQHLFLVRLWTETTTVPIREDWHGLVEHVPTGEKRYFTSLADLNEFMNARLEGAAQSLDSVCERSDESLSEC